MIVKLVVFDQVNVDASHLVQFYLFDFSSRWTQGNALHHRKVRSHYEIGWHW